MLSVQYWRKISMDIYGKRYPILPMLKTSLVLVQDRAMRTWSFFQQSSLKSFNNFYLQFLEHLITYLRNFSLRNFRRKMTGRFKFFIITKWRRFFKLWVASGGLYSCILLLNTWYNQSYSLNFLMFPLGELVKSGFFFRFLSINLSDLNLGYNAYKTFKMYYYSDIYNFGW